MRRMQIPWTLWQNGNFCVLAFAREYFKFLIIWFLEDRNFVHQRISVKGMCWSNLILNLTLRASSLKIGISIILLRHIVGFFIPYIKYLIWLYLIFPSVRIEMKMNMLAELLDSFLGISNIFFLLILNALILLFRRVYHAKVPLGKMWDCSFLTLLRNTCIL